MQAARPEPTGSKLPPPLISCRRRSSSRRSVASRQKLKRPWLPGAGRRSPHPVAILLAPPPDASPRGRRSRIAVRRRLGGADRRGRGRQRRDRRAEIREDVGLPVRLVPDAPSSAGSAARSTSAPSPTRHRWGPTPPPPRGTTSPAGPATCAAPSSGRPAARSRSRSSGCRGPRPASSSSRPKLAGCATPISIS